MLMQNLYVYNLICYRNTISKGTGSGIKVVNCKGSFEDPLVDMDLPTDNTQAEDVFNRCTGDNERVTLIDNYIIEI